MKDPEAHEIIQQFHARLHEKIYPCVAAHHAADQGNIHCMVADHMACPRQDNEILQFIYGFTDTLRKSPAEFQSAVILFKAPKTPDESAFDAMFWSRLQALSDLDSMQYGYDPRVDKHIDSPKFSYSLKEEAFYIIGLHPASSRLARQFPLPAMVFNAHAQFEKLRHENRYTKMQQLVRKRDLAYSGSVNPMLSDFGESSEVFQYSGRRHESDWECPLILRHASNGDHTTS